MNLENSIDRLRVEIADLDKVIAIFETLSGRLTRTRRSARNKTNPKKSRRKKSRQASRGNLRLLV
jgi:hypothetical protein